MRLIFAIAFAVIASTASAQRYYAPQPVYYNTAPVFHAQPRYMTQWPVPAPQPPQINYVQAGQFIGNAYNIQAVYVGATTPGARQLFFGNPYGAAIMYGIGPIQRAY